MEQAERLLREWCERHPGWHASSYPGSFDASHRFKLWNSVQQFGKNFGWTAGSEAERDYRAWRAAEELICYAERWIEANSNEGSGCTPTR